MDGPVAKTLLKSFGLELNGRNQSLNTADALAATYESLNRQSKLFT
ncbi:MAG: hypothetical protein JSR78_09545 [Proteobacteria bacterium]|nr:hypothetical protein [Pseudomonadota bacterium]